MHGLAAHSNWKQPSERQPQQLMRHPTTDDGHKDSGRATVDNFSDFSDQTAEQSNEHLEFLNDKDRDFSMLNRHQAVKQLFLRYNTALASSAPVERLFSSGSLTLSKRRNRLSDKLPETLLMLKTNKQFR